MRYYSSGKKFNLELFLLNLLIPQTVGILSFYLSGPVSSEYESFIKPAYSPPAFVFSIVWSVLYFFMGAAAYLVSTSFSDKRKTALFFYTSQLAVNFLWLIFFFGMELKLFSFFWIILLIVLSLKTYQYFSDINKLAGIFLIPYILWLFYAGYLNIGIWFLN